MSTSDWRRNTRVRINRGTDLKPDTGLDKLMPVTEPPLMTKLHYSFEEALRYIKKSFSNFTPENFLNHGFQGDVSFFIKVPSSIKVSSPRPSLVDERKDLGQLSPEYLVLSSLDCEMIEVNKTLQQNKFQKGYFFDNIYKVIDAFPNYNTATGESYFWVIEGEPLTILVKDLIVNHDDLQYLVKIIELKLSNNYSYAIKEKFKTEKSSIHFFDYFIRLSEITSDNVVSSAEDLILEAIKKQISLIAMTPTDVIIRSSTYEDVQNGVEYYLRPKCFELNKSDCKDIYLNGNVKIKRFLYGYYFSVHGTLIKISPFNERPKTTNIMTEWEMYKNNMPFECNLVFDDLYINKVDLSKLTNIFENKPSDIPEETITFFNFNKCILLDRANKMVRLSHAKCTIDHILYLAFQKKLDIFTPIPVGVEIKGRGFNSDGSDNIFDLSCYRESYLVLNHYTCLEFIINEELSECSFSADFSSICNNIKVKLNAKYKKENLISSGYEVKQVKTYYKGIPFNLKLNIKNLYVRENSIVELISNDLMLTMLFSKIVELHSENNVNPILNLQNYNEKISSEKISKSVTSEIFAEKVDGDEMSVNSQANEAPIETTLVDKKEHLLHSNYDVDQELNLPIGEITLLNRSEVISLLKISKSKLYTIMNLDSKYYDAEFPRPVGSGVGKKQWLESEIKAYITKRMNDR